MATTNTSRVYTSFKTTALELGLEPTPSTASKLFSRAKSVILGGRNAAARQGIEEAHMRPYMNRNGEQEVFASIVKTDRAWAEELVTKNRDRFAGGLRIMNRCEDYLLLNK